MAYVAQHAFHHLEEIPPCTSQGIPGEPQQVRLYVTGLGFKV